MSIPFPVLGALVVIGLLIGCVYIYGLSKKWGILVPYAGMLLFGSMALPLTWNDRINPTVWLPIQRIRSELFLASGAAALLVVLFQSRRLRGKAQSLSVWLLVTAGMYAALLRFVHDSPAQGAFSIAFGIATLLPLALVAAIAMDDIEDFPILLRTITFVNSIWVAMVFVQIAANPKFVTMGNQYRFVGIFSNPQHSGVLMAFFCVIVLWLLLNDHRKYKLFYLALLGIDGLFLLWSGSRTGMGMTIIGVSAVLYSRAGRAILFLPIVAIISFVGLKMMIGVLGIDFGVERLTSTANTRDYAWWKLFTTGMENPLFGVGTLESEKSENSWLFGFAAFGIGMVSLLVLMTVVAMAEFLQSLRLRFSMPAHLRPMLDLTLGLIAMYFAGAMLEGYIISRVSSALCFYPIAASAGAIIRRHARLYQSDGSYDQNDLYSDDGEYADYGDSNEYDDYGDQGDNQSSAAYS
jgi:hypothetical protein